MISLHGIQELYLLSWPHADLPSVRHVFSCSAGGSSCCSSRCPLPGASNVSEQALDQAWPTFTVASPENVTLQKRKGLTLQVMSAKYQLFSDESKSPHKLYATFWDFSSFPFSFRVHVFRYQKVANACQKAAGGGVFGRLVLAGVLPLAANGHALGQLLLKSLIDKSGSAKVVCTPSSGLGYFGLKALWEIVNTN